MMGPRIHPSHGTDMLVTERLSPFGDHRVGGGTRHMLAATGQLLARQPRPAHFGVASRSACGVQDHRQPSAGATCFRMASMTWAL